MSNTPAQKCNDLVIAVDFDGTCVTHEYPKVGRHVGAPRVLSRIAKEGGRIILWTMRSGTQLQDAVNWFEEHGIPLFGVQRNPTQDEWTSSPKCYAHVYIDDAALGCPTKPGLKGERPFVDWDAVESILWPDEIPNSDADTTSLNQPRKLTAEFQRVEGIFVIRDENGNICRTMRRDKRTDKWGIYLVGAEEPYDSDRFRLDLMDRHQIQTFVKNAGSGNPSE